MLSGRDCGSGLHPLTQLTAANSPTAEHRVAAVFTADRDKRLPGSSIIIGIKGCTWVCSKPAKSNPCLQAGGPTAA